VPAHWPEELQASAVVHWSPSLHAVPTAAWFALQEPDPLHESALSHGPLEGLPQAVPAGLTPLSWQAPEAHLSWLVHSVPASPQAVPSARWFALQEPDPSHESALSHAPLDPSPHALPAALNPLSWQAPAAQLSWLMHSVPESPQAVPSARWFTRQEPDPLHESAWSHAPLDPSPQALPAALNPLSWQTPARHASALTHWLPASPHAEPSVARFARQNPDVLQVSAALH